MRIPPFRFRPVDVPPVGRLMAVFLVATATAAPLLAAVQVALAWTTTGWQLTQFATVVGFLVAMLVGPRPLPAPPVVRHRLIGVSLLAVALGALVAGGTGLLADLVGVPPDPVPTTVPWSVAVVVGTVAGALGEEIGWRGLAQPLLETRFCWWNAAIVVGVLFGAGHFPVLAAGPVVFAVFVGSAVGLSVLAAWLGRGRSRWHRVVLGTVLHAVVNLGLVVVGTRHDLSSVAGVVVMAASTTVAASAVLAVTVRRRTTVSSSARWRRSIGVSGRVSR